MKKTAYFMVFVLFTSACAKKNDVKVNDNMLTIRVRVSRAGLDLPDVVLERAFKDLKKSSGVLVPNTANPTIASDILTIDMRISNISDNVEPIGVFRYFINDQDSGTSATSSAFTINVPDNIQGSLFETPVYQVRWYTQFEGK